MSDEQDYSPFPETELQLLADHFSNIGQAWSGASPVSAKLRAECFDRADICRNAIKCYDALRERALLAEHRLSQLEHIAPHGLAD